MKIFMVLLVFTTSFFISEISHAEDSEYSVRERGMPNYPRRASSRGIEGFCIVSFDISNKGDVHNSAIEECSPKIFESQSLNAINNTKYNPRIVNGSAVEVVGVRTRYSYILGHDVEDGFYKDLDVGDGYYTGAIANRKKQGFGTMKYNDGAVYEGEWKSGIKHGKGKHTYSTGVVLDGNFSGDLFHGPGERRSPGGIITKGNWVQERLSYGTIHVPGHFDYEGGLKFTEKDGMWTHWPDGKGRLEWENGNWYEGDIKLLTLDGNGKYYYANKNKLYEGQFKDGLRHGLGYTENFSGKKDKGKVRCNKGSCNWTDKESKSGINWGKVLDGTITVLTEVNRNLEAQSRQSPSFSTALSRPIKTGHFSTSESGDSSPAQVNVSSSSTPYQERTSSNGGVLQIQQTQFTGGTCREAWPEDSPEVKAQLKECNARRREAQRNAPAVKGSRAIAQ